MDFIPDYERVLRTATGHATVYVVSDQSEQLDPAVKRATHPVEWSSMLIVAASEVAPDFAHGEPRAILRSIVQFILARIPAAPSAGSLQDFEAGLMEWILEHRRTVAPRDWEI